MSLVGTLAMLAMARVGSMPGVADALRSERELQTAPWFKLGYPEFEKPRTGERPIGIANMRCDNGLCSYDVVVERQSKRRTVHRNGVLFCPSPEQLWVTCVD